MKKTVIKASQKKTAAPLKTMAKATPKTAAIATATTPVIIKKVTKSKAGETKAGAGAKAAQKAETKKKVVAKKVIKAKTALPVSKPVVKAKIKSDIKPKSAVRAVVAPIVGKKADAKKAAIAKPDVRKKETKTPLKVEAKPKKITIATKAPKKPPKALKQVSKTEKPAPKTVGKSKITQKIATVKKAPVTLKTLKKKAELAKKIAKTAAKTKMKTKVKTAGTAQKKAPVRIISQPKEMKKPVVTAKKKVSPIEVNIVKTKKAASPVLSSKKKQAATTASSVKKEITSAPKPSAKARTQKPVQKPVLKTELKTVKKSAAPAGKTKVKAITKTAVSEKKTRIVRPAVPSAEESEDELLSVAEIEAREGLTGVKPRLKIFLPREDITEDSADEKEEKERHRSLPAEYGENVFFMIVVDPILIFLDWELVTPDYPAEGISLCVRIYDVTGITFDGSNAHGFTDIMLDSRSGSGYCEINMQGKEIVAEIGFINAHGKFTALLRSGKATVPPLLQYDELGIVRKLQEAGLPIGY